MQDCNQSPQQAKTMKTQPTLPSALTRRRFLTGSVAALCGALAIAGTAAREPYAWEKEGPAVTEFVIKPVTGHPSLLMDPSGIPGLKARYEIKKIFQVL
jgi:hypothetical protein